MSPAVVGDVGRGDPTDWVVGRPAPVSGRRSGDRRGRRRGRLRTAAEGRTRAGGRGRAGSRCCRGRTATRRGTRDNGTGSSRSASGTASRSPGSAASPCRRSTTSALRRRTRPVRRSSPQASSSWGTTGRGVPTRPPADPCRPTGCVTGRSRCSCGCGRTSTAGRRRCASSPHRPAARRRSGDGDRPHAGRRAARGAGKGRRLQRFHLHGDRSGEQTPRFAHIRKMNPRNGTLDDRTHRLLRRGIPFATSAAGREVARPAREGRRERRRAGRARSGVQRLHGEHREPVRVPAAELGEQPRLAPAGGR